MNQDKISFVNIYTECNNHLREMDKNRDQLISFYILLVGAFLTVFHYLSDGTLKYLLSPISGLLFILGIILSRTANEFRLWHTRYSYTAILLVALSRGKNEEEFLNIQSELREYSYSEEQLRISSIDMPYRWVFTRYWKGTEFYTYLAALTVAYLPLYLLFINLIPGFQSLNTPLEIIVFVLGLCIYFLISFYLSATYLYKKFSECPWATWLLYGIDKGLDSTLKKMQKS